MSSSLNYMKKCYTVTDNKTRKLFIERVFCQRKKPIKEIAKELGIKYSTAKAIIRVYKSEGRTDKKSKKIHKKQKMTNASLIEEKQEMNEFKGSSSLNQGIFNPNFNLVPNLVPSFMNPLNAFNFQNLMNNSLMYSQMLQMQFLSQTLPQNPLFNVPAKFY